ncbi:MAG TPA: carboxypeptidase regulatory-like domain-containing protein [Candidatus Thermoplasmatota archaeon]
MVPASAVQTGVVVAVALLLGAAGGWLLPSLRPGTFDGAADPMQIDDSGRTVPIHGFVLDLEFYPIPDATLTVVETAAEFRSTGDGSYGIAASPGNYLVIASAPGYRSAAASLSVFYGQQTRHDFMLESKPIGDPYYEILPFTAVIGCQVAANEVVVDCSPAFSANRLAAKVPVRDSTANALTELHWKAQSQLATHVTLRSTLEADGSRIDVGTVGDITGMKIWLLDWLLHKHMRPGLEWENQLELRAPLGEDDVWGNKGGTGVGYAQDQAIDVYTTVFHYAPGPGDFTATTA